MKKINLKKALASVAALSAVACMAAVPASAATNEFAASSKPSVAIEQVTLTLDEVKANNYQVPVLVKVQNNPGVNALEFGVKADVTYTVVNDSDQVMDTLSALNGANADLAKGLQAEMTIKASTVEPGLTWMTWAASDVKANKERFAVVLVTVPEDVIVENVHLGDSLMTLAYCMHHEDEA